MALSLIAAVKRLSLKRKLLILAVCVFVVFLAWRLVTLIQKGSHKDSLSYGRPPVAVEVENAVFSHIQDIREYTGTVYPLYRYIVAPKVSGRVIEIRKRIGDMVSKGEMVVRIDDAEYQQAVFEAEANLKIAQASLAEAHSQLELAKQELERIQSLQEKGIASPSELDAAVTQHNAQFSRLNFAKAQVEQREAALKSARIRLGYTVLSAPEPGYIGERFVDEGALLAPNAPVVSVIGIGTVIVRTSIIERDYGGIRVGQKADIMVDAFASKRFQGTVARIAPQLEEASRVATMEVEVANDSLYLKPGMFATVGVVLSEKESAQVVPGKAIVRRNGREGVFVIAPENETALFIPVTTGIISTELTEITSPRLEGKIITLGQHLLEDGSAILLPGGGQKALPGQEKGKSGRGGGAKPSGTPGGSPRGTNR